MNGFRTLILEAAGANAVDGGEAALELGGRRLNLVSPEEGFIGVEDGSDWSRGGAESYCCSGIIVYTDIDGSRLSRRVFAKAYAGFTIGISVEERVATWQERAAVLSGAGISVCVIYSAFKGVLLEEFVPWTLAEYLEVRQDIDSWRQMAQRLARLAQDLDGLRVHPVALVPDLRTDGSRICVVDFGEDLGEVPGQSMVPDYCFSLMRTELLNFGLERMIEWM